MKKANKVLAVLTVLAMAGTLSSSLYGCGNQQPSTNSGTSSGSASASKESPEIEIWVGQVRDFAEVTKVQEQWKEKLGFNTRIKNVTGDVPTALNLVISSGGFKDLAVLPKNDAYNNTIVRSGSVMEVGDILSNEDYENLSTIPQQYLDVSKDKDGKFWYIPTEWDVNPDDPWPGWTRSAFTVRLDLLEQLGMKKEDIKTLDDFENYLKKVSELKDENGEPIIPTTYINKDNPADINTALTAFGVKTGRASGGVVAVDKVGDEFVFMYDNPHYKECFQWLNHLVREGLMDEESVVQSTDLQKQKLFTGRYGATIGRMDLPDNTTSDQVARQYDIIPFPEVEGVEAPGQQYVVNPYPKSATYISKNTKNLDAILEFMNWALGKEPERNFELNEGMEGIYWHWVDEPYGAWEFEPDYLADRNNPATHSTLQPEMYMLGTMSKEWYPWWTQKSPEDSQIDIEVDVCHEIYENYGTTEVVHSWDMVRSESGSKWEKYGPTLTQVVTEATPKLILSASDDEFEKEWSAFQKDMEEKAHWSELKEEWFQLYDKQTEVTGKW